MKNWNYINGAQIGNRDVSPSRLKDIEEQIKNWEHALEKVEGLEKEKAKKILEDLRKERQQIRDNVGNSDGTEKLFHSLEKDVEKKEEKNDEEIEKVGNDKSVFSKGDFEIKQIEKSNEDAYMQKYYGMKKGNYCLVNKKTGVVYGWYNDLSSAKSRLEEWIDNNNTFSRSKTGNAGYPVLKSKIEELAKEGKSYEEAVNELLKFGYSKADIAQYEAYIREKIGNRKTGNSDPEEEYWKKQFIEAARKKGWTEKAIQEFIKKIEKEGAKGVMIPVKNSADDDKFAYVMREFDEGKLKTPDGKVVTDPAQAKAIAYSESKKAENGCARARNAMKCGNKEVTLWKGNDSVLIKSDGTVLYLESNSFETDRDKFDSQETAVKEMAKQGYKSK